MLVASGSLHLCPRDGAHGLFLCSPLEGLVKPAALSVISVASRLLYRYFTTAVLWKVQSEDRLNVASRVWCFAMHRSVLEQDQSNVT